MATSGTFINNYGSWWRMRLTWSASQNVSNNTSTITARLYWETRGGNGAVYSSDTKSGYLDIDGSRSNFTGTARLSNGGSRHVKTYTKTVSHRSDGTQSVGLDGSFSINVSLSGRYYGTVSVSGTANLDTIPRESNMSTSRNWTAGSNRTISISRYSGSFRHEVEVYVKQINGSWNWVNQVAFSTSQTSKSTSFTVAEKKEIFNILDGRSSADTQMILQTYSGSTFIGSKYYYGTVTAPNASYTVISNPIGRSEASGQGDQTVYIDQSISIDIRRYDSEFTHTLKIKDGNSGSVVHTKTGATSSYTWNPSTSEENQLYNNIPNGTEFDGDIEIYTYYHGVQVRGVVSRDINFKVRNSEPSFSSSQISYADINSATTAITGNSQYVIQGESSLRAYVDSVATARNGSSISHYIVSVNGVSNSIPTASYSTFGSVNTSTNTSLSVKAVDSRGFSTTVSKTVTMIPYNKPVVKSTSERLNGYEDDTTLSLSGSISTLNIGGVNKNSVLSAKYQYRQQNVGSFTTLTSFSISQTIPTYKAVDKVLVLFNLKAWEVRVEVTDKLGTTTVTKIVPVGQPLFFIDSEKKSVGINDFPVDPNEFRINGKIVVGSGTFAHNGPDGDGNIDINASGKAMRINYEEGGHSYIEWNGGGVRDGYIGYSNGYATNFTISNQRDPNRTGWLRLGQEEFDLNGSTAKYNGTPVFSDTQGQTLWEGAFYMNSGQTINPTKNITDCPNGWVLSWSDYDVPTGTAKNYQWVQTFVHKSHVMDRGSNPMYVVIAQFYSTILAKEIKCTNTSITGHNNNSSTDDMTDVVLRRVYEW